MEAILKTQKAMTSFEVAMNRILLQKTFIESFKDFNYEEVMRLSPKFSSKTFFSYNEELDEILSTATISFLTEKGLLPSEFYFDFKIPSEIRKEGLVELGKLAKKLHSPLKPEHQKLPYISLLLAIKEYSKQHGITGWVASVHSSLLKDIQKIGIPVQILADKVMVENSITKAMGNYIKDVKFIYATMEDSFRALDNYQFLIDNGIITIEI